MDMSGKIQDKLISIDKRYKLTSKDIEEMNVLRGQGKTLEDLAKYFKISQATVLYWTDEEYRNKQRLKNATTQNQLINIWGTLNKTEQKANLALKDKLKTKLK